MKDIEIEDLTRQFFSELRETVDDVEADLLRLEESYDPEILRSAFRAFHTIKGNAGLVGQAEIQAACHAMETSLGVRNSELLTPEVIQDGLQLVDVLRACARGESVDGNRAELGRLTAASVGLEAGAESSPAGDQGRSSQIVDRRTGSLSVDEFRILVRHFAPLWRADQTIARLASTADTPARNEVVQDMGLAVLDYLDAVPDSLPWYRSVGRYLEHALNLIIMTGIDYDPTRFDLLHTLVFDVEQAIKGEFIGATFVESILLDDPDSVSALPSALAVLTEPSIVAISIRMPFDRLARAGRTLESLRESAADPRHTVFFIIDDAGETERITRSLADVLDGYPIIGASIWEGLLYALAPEV